MAETVGGACGALYHHSIWGVQGMKLVGDRIPLIFRFLRFVTQDNITYVSPGEMYFECR
jgi:hypothetical protein